MRPASRMFLFTIAAMFVVGCVSRSVPERFPTASAASPSAPEPRPEPASRTLVDDPPLPGENTEQWPGLRPSNSRSGEPAHRHGRHGQHRQSEAPVDASEHP